MELKLTEFREISELCDALLSMAAFSATTSHKKALESAAALIAYQAGQLSAVNRRLEGDMSEIPDAALLALVRQRCPSIATTEQALESTAMLLAKDVRLICFFRTLAEHSDEEPSQ